MSCALRPDALDVVQVDVDLLVVVVEVGAGRVREAVVLAQDDRDAAGPRTAASGGVEEV